LRLANLLTAVAFFVFVFLGACAAVRTPATFVRYTTGTFDEPGAWKSIEVREGISKDNLWRAAFDALAEKYDIEAAWKENGYIRTGWKYTGDRYLSRITLRMLGDDWATLKVRCEAMLTITPGYAIYGQDTRLLQDVYGDLQGRVGRVRR
jgi:hypothetical protein